MRKVAENAPAPERSGIYAELANLAKNNHPDTALFFARRSMHLADSIGTPVDKARANAMVGRVLALKGSYDLSLKYSREALALAGDNDSLIALSHDGIGNAFWQLGKHAEALENHFKALQIREQTGDTRGTSVSKANIGMIYQSQNKLPLAEKYVKEALAIADKINRPLPTIIHPPFPRKHLWHAGQDR